MKTATAMNENAIELINYFHKAPYGKEIEFAKMNAKSAPLGYLVNPECCTQLVWDWLDTLTEDYNATFYKEWTDVISKNRFELFIDQILHYSTTYGTDFTQEGNGYVPNDGSVSPNFKSLKVIDPISNEDLYLKCAEILTSGIALKDKTMKVLCEFLNEKKQIPFSAEFIESIKNREAQAYLSYISGTKPRDEFGLLRYLMYALTGKCSVIKDKKTISTIKTNIEVIDKTVLSLTEKELGKLSRIFKRYKPIFLAMKTKNTSRAINRLRKLSDRNHTPLKAGYWETLISVPRDLKELQEKVVDLDNFHKVRLIQCANVALYSKETDKVYQIRNGKVYTREDYHPEYNLGYVMNVKDILERSLIDSLSKKACKVKYHDFVNMTLPSSEKSYVGNFPVYSSIDIGKNGVIGINWRSSDGTDDFDLSMIDFKGNKIGWNSSFYNNNYSIVYSGDMTSANPEATELMYIKKSCPDSLIFVNQFRGIPKSKFRFFVGTECIDIHNIRNHMIDKNNIRMDDIIEIDNEPQKTIGFISCDKLYLMDFKSGNRIISYNNRHSLSTIHTLTCRCNCYVMLKDILEKSGFIEDNDNPDIDFSNVEKDTIIKLMS